VKLFEERNNKYKEISKQYMANKLADKREKFELSYEKYLINRKQEEDLREEKIFKKYQGYVRIIFLYLCLFI
jgi:hypothetical protein